jgi:PIN domain nuclease of toxin-antitoxin system
MLLLLDTHVLLWWFTDDPRLSASARAAIADSDNRVHVSAASAWEIATKQRIGKLVGVPDAAQRYSELIEADDFRHLPISHLHALRAGAWRVAHRDPFDRILAAQSELDRIPLVTRDPVFDLFGVETLW